MFPKLVDPVPGVLYSLGNRPDIFIFVHSGSESIQTFEDRLGILTIRIDVGVLIP
jgi:hypothetical protein